MMRASTSRGNRVWVSPFISEPCRLPVRGLPRYPASSLVLVEDVENSKVQIWMTTIDFDRGLAEFPRIGHHNREANKGIAVFLIKVDVFKRASHGYEEVTDSAVSEAIASATSTIQSSQGRWLTNSANKLSGLFDGFSVENYSGVNARLTHFDEGKVELTSCQKEMKMAGQSEFLLSGRELRMQ